MHKGIRSMVSGSMLIGIMFLSGGRIVSAKPIDTAVGAGATNKVRFAVGWSQAPDPAAAAQAAVQGATQVLGTAVKGAVFYESYPDEKDTKSAHAAIRGALGANVPLIGVSGEPLVNGGHLRNNALAVLLIGGDAVSVKVVKAKLEKERDKTGAALAVALSEVQDLGLIIALAEPNLSFEEGVTVEDFLHGVKKTLGKKVTIWGGNGKPEKYNAKMEATTFYNDEMLSGHVVALGLGGPLGIAATHTSEFLPVGDPVTVTKIDPKNPKIVLEFDHKPANEIYRRSRGMGADKPIANVDPPCMVGVILPNNHIYTRVVLQEEKETGGLGFITSIPEGTRLQILSGGDKVEKIYESAKQGLAETMAAVPCGSAPLLALPSDCCARGFRVAGYTEGKGDEILQGCKLAMGANEIPVFGFYAYGELGPLAGEYKGLPYQYMQHTFTLVLLYGK